MKRLFFLVCLFLPFFLDCRSTNHCGYFLAICLLCLLFFHLKSSDLAVLFTCSYCSPAVFTGVASIVFNSCKSDFLLDFSWFFYFVEIFVTTIWRYAHFKSTSCLSIHAIATELRVWSHFHSFWALVTYITLRKVFSWSQRDFFYYYF